MRLIVLIALLSVAVGCGSQPSHHASSSNQANGREQTVSQTENDQLTVYVTATGERYHLSSCRTLRGKGRPISLGDAKRRGYTPCKVCQPPR
jgi:hypothetical protein